MYGTASLHDGLSLLAEAAEAVVIAVILALES